MNKHRSEREDYLTGVHSVTAAISAGRRIVQQLWVTPRRSPDFQELLALARKHNIPTINQPAEQLQQRSRHTQHQGVVALVTDYPYVEVAALIDQVVQHGDQGFLVVLDQIQDPHNLGAIARTALGCGAQGMIVPQDRSALVTPAVVRSSAGATEWLPIAQVTNVNNAIKLLKDNNIWVVGLEADGDTDLYKHNFSGAHAVVLGSEGEGLRKLVRKNCDTIISIPMQGPVGSYNVSVAAAMILGEVARQKQLKKP